MYFVYKICNDINDKVYVGRTVRTLRVRWLEHLKSCERGDSRHLYCAMRKYGVEHFTIEEIYRTTSFEDMVAKEAYYCDLYKAYTCGYNMTTAGEINPMDCEKSKASHDERMRTKAVKDKISKTMKNVRNERSGYVYIHRDKEMKYIDPKLLSDYLDDGWKEGTRKGRVRIHKDNRENTVFEDELELYLSNGWNIGGKPGRMTLEQKQKLAQSHKNISEKFKLEQSERLKAFYENNPDWITKAKKAVIITDPETFETFEFDSCLNLCRYIGAPESVARSGKISGWVKAGFITRRNSKYNGWNIKYKEKN